MAIVDIILIVIIGIAALIGFKQGAMKTVLSLFGLLISLIVAYVLAGAILESISGYGFIQRLFYAETGSIASWVAAKLESLAGLTAGVSAEVLSEQLAGTPFALAAPLIAAALPLLDPSMAGLPLNQTIGVICANVVLFAIITMVLFILIRVVLGIIESIINKMRKIKVIGSADHFLGLFAGAAKGLISAIAILAVVYALSIPFQFMNGIVDSIRESALTGPLYSFVGGLIEKYFNITSFLSGLIPAGEWIMILNTSNLSSVLSYINI